MKTTLLFAILTFSLNAFAQVSKTVTISAGELAAVLTANEKSTITDLTIKGTIDARDFKTMRNEITSLAVLDISEVTVVAYFGADGTAGNTTFNYPENEIPERAFSTLENMGKISLNTIIFPSSINAIGRYSLLYCTGLTAVKIPSSVSSIKRSAFNGCTKMASLVFESPASLATIDTFAFRNCDGLQSVTIPSSVKTIDYGAFYDCSELISILFDSKSSLATIGESVFSFCNKIVDVFIPSSVTTIGTYAFYNCGALLHVDKNNLNYTSENGILFNKAKTTLIQCPSSWNKNYDIPTSVSIIGPSAFSRCSLLTGIKIPSSVTIIGSNAFWGCTNLTGSITIPSAVKSIGEYAFSGCSGITAIYCYSIEPFDINLSEDVFYNVNKNICTLHVPKGSAQDYEHAYQWYEFNNIIEMPGFAFSSNQVKIDAAHGSTASVDISADVSWKASSDQPWLSVNSGSGSGNGKLTFTATANPTTTIRSANVTVTSTGVESRTVSVVQSYALQTNIIKLYDFDCQNPYSFAYNSRLVYDGTYLYGIMGDISFDPKSKLIRIKPDGSNFEVLHEFDFSGYANVHLTVYGNMLYGTVNDYEIQDDILFKINTDGTGYKELSFVKDYKLKLGYNSLIISNNLIYGSTHDYSSSNGKQNLFKVNTDGSGYSVLYSSTENSFDNLTLSGNTIIGVNYGKVVKVNIDGSGFFDFGINSDIPVTVDKNIIYGIKSANEGTEGYIFKVNMDGTGFTKIKSITYPNFGSSPIGCLSIVGNSIYGMDENNSGIFKINTDGSGFSQIQTDLKFGEYSTSSELTLIWNELFGFTGGEIFKINTSTDVVSGVFKFVTSTSGILPTGTLVESDNFLFGTTVAGGKFDAGTLFRINKDGSNYTKLFDFNGVETGTGSIGQLTLIGDELYGTLGGGIIQEENGCIFKIKTNGSGFTILHKFDGTNGASPNGSLVFHKGCLYGITSGGGKENHGVIFKINPDGTGFTKISENTDFDTGESSFNGITISEDDVIYGVTAIDYGGVFKVNTDGSGLRKIFDFYDESGVVGVCKPLLLNDELYITTSDEGKNGFGTIFKIKTDGTGLKVLYNFEGVYDNPDSWSERNNSLLYHNRKLYGTATRNGINNHGYLYEINLDGTGFTKLSDFNGEYGSIPYLCDLIIDENEDIFGMTTVGGLYSGGIIYKYALGEPNSVQQEIADKPQIQVFPNPTNGIVQLKFNTELQPDTWITVYNFSGKMVMKTQVFHKEENINMRGNKPGLYFIKVNQGNSNKTFKIVLE